MNGRTRGLRRSAYVTVCTPAAGGGVYRPAAVIVPVDVDPPTTPSTDHSGVPSLAGHANCCASVGVSTATRGVMEKPVPVPVTATCAGPTHCRDREGGTPDRGRRREGYRDRARPIWSQSPDQLLVCAKSPGFAPVIEMLVIVSIPVPLLVTVTFCGALDAGGHGAEVEARWARDDNGIDPPSGVAMSA